MKKKLEEKKEKPVGMNYFVNFVTVKSIESNTWNMTN